MTIRNLTRNTLLADKTEIANTMIKRMKGLLGRRGLKSNEALVIVPCQSVHMVFMKFAIDVVFVDHAGAVVGVCANLRPFQFSPLFTHAHQAIEVPSGAIARSQTRIGDSIQIS